MLKKQIYKITFYCVKCGISIRRNVNKSVAQGKGYLHFLLELTNEMDVRRYTTKLLSRYTLNDK